MSSIGRCVLLSKRDYWLWQFDAVNLAAAVLWARVAGVAFHEPRHMTQRRKAISAKCKMCAGTTSALAPSAGAPLGKGACRPLCNPLLVGASRQSKRSGVLPRQMIAMFGFIVVFEEGLFQLR